MEAAMVEMSARQLRERLVGFVDEVVRPLPHLRQRENALVYVRGLIEHGGRKSFAADVVSARRVGGAL
jgi:hypothetical protein